MNCRPLVLLLTVGAVLLGCAQEPDATTDDEVVTTLQSEEGSTAPAELDIIVISGDGPINNIQSRVAREVIQPVCETCWLWFCWETSCS